METFIFWFIVAFCIVYGGRTFLKDYRIFKSGVNNSDEAAKFLAGVKPDKLKRTPNDILKDIVLVTDVLNTLKQELLMSVKKEQSIAEEAEQSNPNSIPIAFNSDEIACRFQGADVPKYIKDESGRWFEFESLAAYDEMNRAIVDDMARDYVTIRDEASNSAFFFRHIDDAPVLKENLEKA